MSQDAANHLLEGLTGAQREAVMHMEGPLLVLAGAGSGKTRVITRRVAYLLEQGVRPGNLLAITFTNKAAGEMRQRIEALVPTARLWISTFHSFGARILREYAGRLTLDRNFTIYDQTDRARVVKIAMEDVQVHNGKFTPDAISSAISKAKNQLLTPEKYVVQANDFFTATAARVYPAYERRLRDAHALDFDDLLFWPAMALKHDPEIRAELDARFRYVLIDEYQDTNTAQYAIARGLSIDFPNLCVVGDPDQSIYGWRGSDIRNIMDFERDFPNARVLTLEQNYRSTGSILHAASMLIANNKKRKPKNLVTDNPQGDPVRVLTFETGIDEAHGIARRIKETVQRGERTYRDFALFLRVNALSRALEQAFVQQQVPYQIVRGLAFFERKENRDVLAYLRLLVNPHDAISFLRVINEPARGLGKVTLEHLSQYAEPRELSLLAAAAEASKAEAIKGKAARALVDFAVMMAELALLSEAPPDEVIRQVLTRTGYRKMLKDSNDPEDQDRLANIEELITAASQFAAEDPTRTIGNFLENITLASDVDAWDEQQDCVSVMTLHAAKGLEFPVVYMVAVEQGLLPHERSLQRPSELEEERRLAFVGMTRAKQELYLCHARLREFRGSTLYAVPSYFLEELPEEVERLDQSLTGPGHRRAVDEWRGGGGEAAEHGWAQAGVKTRPMVVGASTFLATGNSAAPTTYTEGMVVRHETYGDGRVTEIGGFGALRKVKVRFGSGERTFLVDKAKLEIVRSK